MGEGNWLFVVVAFIALVLLTIGVIDWLVGWFWLVGGPGDYHGFDHLGFWMRGSRALIDGLSFPSFFSLRMACLCWLVAAHVWVIRVTYCTVGVAVRYGW